MNAVRAALPAQKACEEPTGDGFAPRRFRHAETPPDGRKIGQATHRNLPLWHRPTLRFRGGRAIPRLWRAPHPRCRSGLVLPVSFAPPRFAGAAVEKIGERIHAGGQVPFDGFFADAHAFGDLAARKPVELARDHHIARTWR